MDFSDTHCHLDLPAFDSDREAVLARARAAGVKRFLVPGLEVKSSQRIVSLFATQSDVFAAIGVHPTEAQVPAEGALDKLRMLCSSPKVVAIGEIGLDYYWVSENAARRRQRLLLEQQLDLARQAALPVILHSREAGDAAGGACADDLLAALRDWVAGLRASKHSLSERPGVLHSFAGTLDDALQAVDLGFCIGVTGPITYKNAAERRQMIASLPLDRLLLETDSPFLPPAPHRGKRNEPAFVTHIADKIADVQSRTAPEIATVTAANAARLFAWGDPV